MRRFNLDGYNVIKAVFIAILIFMFALLHPLAAFGAGSHQESMNAVEFNTAENGTLYAFPGEIVNTSYYVGQSLGSISYYQVTVTLNSSSYETLNSFPIFETVSGTSGYYIGVSITAPNDQPGTWWNVGYQIIPVEENTVNILDSTVLTATGSQVSLNDKYQLSPGGTYSLSGKAIFNFSQNVTSISLYPTNPPNCTIVSTQVNGWSFSNSELTVYFSAYEYIGGSGSDVPPSVSATVSYYVSQSSFVLGDPFQATGPKLQLVQGDGAYIMGITSSQIAEITSSINQTLSVPISELNAAVVSINDDVATISTSFGKMITSLNNINATIENISKGEAIINTELGSIEVSLSSLNATISGVMLNTIQIQTSLGTVRTSLSNLNSSMEYVSKGIAYISTSVGTLKIPISYLNATVLRILNGTATIEASIGTVETNLRSINATIVSISGENATLLTSLGTIEVDLSEINTTFVTYGNTLAKLNGSIVDIDTAVGNISGTVTKIYNNTATIATSFGNVTASVTKIKNDISSSGNFTRDPISLFNLITIVMLCAILFMVLLTLYSSRNALRIISNRMK